MADFQFSFAMGQPLFVPGMSGIQGRIYSRTECHGGDSRYELKWFGPDFEVLIDTFTRDDILAAQQRVDASAAVPAAVMSDEELIAAWIRAEGMKEKKKKKKAKKLGRKKSKSKRKRNRKSKR